MKAEGRRQKAERRSDDARQSTYFCLLPSAFCFHQLIAGQGTNIDQSSAARNPPPGGGMVLKVNATGDGPCSSRCLRRFLASSMPGMCPAGTHHIEVRV